jgi:hypothetical protein
VDSILTIEPESGEIQLYPPTIGVIIFEAVQLQINTVLLKVKYQELYKTIVNAFVDDILVMFNPEIAVVHDSLDTEQQPNAAVEDPMKEKERPTRIAPKRKGDLEKWKTVWDYLQMRGYQDRWGMDSARLLDALKVDKKQEKYRGPMFSEETFKNIIRAGKSGELS